MSLNYVTITGTFQDATGNPLTGVASFVPNVTVYAAGIPVLEADVPITAEVVAGALRASNGGAFQLLATDNAGLTYLGQTSFLFYTVTLTLGGQVLDPWSFFLPHTPSTVDLMSLANTAAGGSSGINPPAGDIGGTASSPTVVSTHLASPLPVAQGGTGAATAAAGLAALGGAAVAGDLGGTSAVPQVTGTHLAAPLPVAQGGTGTATGAPQNDVLAGPATGGAGAPAFRALVAADLPPAASGAQGAVQLAGDLAGTAASPQVTGTHLASPLPLAQGGTGQVTQQAAINALTGAQSAGKYLRSDGTNASLAAIQAADVPVLNQNTTGTAANVTGTVGIPNGGTGQTSQQAAIDALAGAQTAGQFLRGNGTHVQMSAIQAGDLPAATTSAQGAVILDGTATDIQPSPGTQAAGASGKSADAAHVHPQPPFLAPTGLTGAAQASRYAGATVSGPPVSGTFAKGDYVVDQSGLFWICRTAGSPGTWGQAGDQPWQFRPESYGAKGDGRIINDATVAGGALSTMTSATAAFTSGDTGKTIMLNGGQGNNAQPLITTITYVSATTVTLGHAASGAVTNASAVYGTDDTAVIQSAITAAGNYAMAAGGPFHAQVLFGAKIYCLATPPPVTTGNSSSTTCQLQIPRPAASGATQKLIIEFLGTGSADANMYFDATVPNVQGSALVSMCIPPYANGTNPYPSVLGFQYAADGSLTGGFANTKAYVDGLAVVIPYLGPQGAYDFRFLGGAGGGRVSAFAFGAPSLGAYNNLANLNNLAGQQNGSSVGLFCPLTGNNDDCTFTSVVVQGFTFGVNITEHVSIQRVASVYNVVGIQCVGGGAHIGASIGYASVEQVFAAIQYTGTSPFTISAVLDCEQVTGWHVQDTQQALYGRVLVHTNTGAPAVLGAANTEVIWDTQPRAVQGAPSYTLGAAVQNPWWHHATVTLAGGTVTGISVGPTSGSLTSLGITSGTFRLPSGWWLSIAGSVKPTTFIAVLD